MKTAPRKPQYGRWSCLWSSGCHARQARPTHQKRNTYCTFRFFDNMPSCMSYWMVPWAGVVESQFSLIKTIWTAPPRPQYGRWSCLWSYVCDARQPPPTHQTRNTYYTFCFFENIGSCMSSWIVHWPGGCKNQFSFIKNNENCTSETAIWTLVVPLVVGCLRKAGTTNLPTT